MPVYIIPLQTQWQNEIQKQRQGRQGHISCVLLSVCIRIHS